MILNPSFRSGPVGTPEIRETDLAEPMQPHEWLMAQQPWPKQLSPEEYARRRAENPEYFVRGKDLYGMRGMKVASSAPLLERK